jgi:hypothetical protein
MRSHASAMRRGQAHCFLISLGHNRVRNQALIAASDLYGAVNHRLAMKLLLTVYEDVGLILRQWSFTDNSSSSQAKGTLTQHPALLNAASNGACPLICSLYLRSYLGFPYIARRMSGCGGWWCYSFAGSLRAKQMGYSLLTDFLMQHQACRSHLRLARASNDCAVSSPQA